MHQTVLLLLRFLHILCGIFWVGATIMLAAFVLPAIRSIGPAGGALMRELAVHRKLPIAMNIAALLTILSGIGLMWEMQTMSNGTWARTPMGVTFSIGALIALGAAIFGNVVSRPTAKKVGVLSTQIAAQGTPPSAEQATQLQALQQRLTWATNVLAVLLPLAATCMAIARYV